MRKELKNNIIRRLKILEGQIRGLRNMIEEEKYCVDIIRQSLAVKRALSSIEDLILQNHLSTHLVEQIKKNKEQKAIKEILEIYKLSKRK